MKQNLILGLIFFVVFFGVKLIFDKNPIETQLLHSVIATAAFLIFRLVFRKNKTEN